MRGGSQVSRRCRRSWQSEEERLGVSVVGADDDGRRSLLDEKERPMTLPHSGAEVRPNREPKRAVHPAARVYLSGYASFLRRRDHRRDQAGLV
jgi:hypothetical protein